MRGIGYVCLVAAMTAAAGAAEAGPRTVVELFTSQGCSSCPPADKLLAKLAHDPQFIVLSLPVDYWDRLGWKDTFAKHAFTERQYAYAMGRGDKQVYTPQAVVNGSEHANGASRQAIDAAAETTPRLGVPMSAQRTGADIAISVGAAATGGATNATIVLLPYLASRDVAIGRGENAREKVTYTNIVRDIVPIGEWSGSAITRTIQSDRYKDFDGIVVLLQAGTPKNPGAILGAARLAIGSKT
ncbi:MAG TPA: DUF1223 domain-containing protein [Hyphomicrobium sp.]|jgi:hypothetical protein